jgi:hypothetical protein
MIVIGRKANQSEHQANIKMNVYPWNSFDDLPKRAIIYLKDTKLLDPKNTPIPLVDGRDWDLCRKIHSHDAVKLLGEMKSFAVNRGEINQTIFREYITTDDTKKRMVKGVEIGQYHQREKLSQGFREWFDEERYFANGNKPKPLSDCYRIATQRITGVDERLRIVATMVKPKAYFADSTNSIAASDKSPYSLLYLLALLNSKLFQWRFKLTSSNNNVGTNELKSLPFRQINFDNPNEAAQHDQMVALVESMLGLHKQLSAAKTPTEKKMLQRQIETTDNQIDTLVYELYGLTDEEIKIVEGIS